MSTEAAVQTATLLSNRVGQSLAGVTSLLEPPERADVMAQAGASALPVVLLEETNELQRKTYECVEKVATILQSQLDLAEEAKRRARDQAAELRKERASGGGAPLGITGTPSGDDAGIFGLSGDQLKNLLTLGFGSVFTVSALKSAFKKFGGKLLRGGAVASLVSLIADPVINFIDKELALELDDKTKKDIEFSLVGTAAGYYLGGIPGAIIGGTLPYISRVGSFIAGKLNANEVKDSDFAATALGGGLAAYFTAGKVGALLKLSTIPRVATFGAALASVPVMIAVGAGVALGVGVTYLAKKIDEYQEMTLNKLEKTTEKLDREMGEWAAREEEGLFERFGINLGQLSALGEAKVAAQEASEQLGQDKEKFLANEGMQTKLSALATTMLNYSDEALGTILKDGTKATNFLDTVENLKNIAAKGGFGDDSKQIFESLAAFSDRVQNVAIKLVDDGVKLSSTGTAVALNKEGIGGDQLENLAGKEEKLESLKKEKQLKEIELEQAKKDLEDAQTRNDGIFFDTKEVNDLQAKIKTLESEIDGRNNPMNLENQIRRIESSMQKFGTTNGLLYNLDELRELYKGDEKTLKAIIQRSIDQSGTGFLQEQQKANETKPENLSPVVISDNKVQTQNNNAKSVTYVSRLNHLGDPIIVREGYTYGL